MNRCTPIKCNNPTPTGGLCASCLRYVVDLELALWGDDDFAIPYWLPKPPEGLGVTEGGVAEQFDEPQVVHADK